MHFEDPDLTCDRLRSGDVDSALSLSREAGWNQTGADWQLMIESGRALGVRHGSAGRLVASALTLPFDGPFAWISMVLVTADYRRRGIATRLLHTCIEQAQALGKTAGLDATPAGREVYLPLGFRPVHGLSRRWARTSPRVAVQVAGTGVRAVQSADLIRLSQYDRRVFGADRSFILHHLAARVPGRALLAQRGDELVGYALSRDGLDAHHLGPIVAEDPTVAQCLAERALAGIDRPVYVDVPDYQHEFSSWLDDLGFVTQRPYTRMLLARDRPYGEPRRAFAVAGPELG